MLEAFFNRLRDLCKTNSEDDASDRTSRIKNQAEQARAVAEEFKILTRESLTWAEARHEDPGLFAGTEHIVDLLDDGCYKITIPPAFGLLPKVVWHPVVNLRGDSHGPSRRAALEFVPATPLEYLSRCIAANEIFGDKIDLVSVLQWRDNAISLGIVQPQYHGEEATDRDIEHFFTTAGWTRIPNPQGHSIFFNYAFEILAVDVEPRNCYVNEGRLLPFDVILSQPDEEISSFLKLYPE